MANKGKIFMTGASGFIGSYMAEKFLEKGYKLAILLRQTNRLNYPAVQRLLKNYDIDVYYGTITDRHYMDFAMKDFQPDYVIHLGAITPVAYSFDHPVEVFETNANGTINLAESARRNCPHLKKFIFSSSMETYGYNPKREPVVETDEQMPGAPYGVAKVAAEKYLKMMNFAYGFPSICFRQTNCYGRRENDYFVVEAIVTKMLKNPETINLGAGDPTRNFIWIDDLVDLWVAAIESENPEILGESFNTGPANGITIQELADICAEKLDWRGDIKWNTMPRRPEELSYLNSNCDKAKKLLEWEPKVGLSEGLDRVIKIWKENLNVN